MHILSGILIPALFPEGTCRIKTARPGPKGSRKFVNKIVVAHRKTQAGNKVSLGFPKNNMEPAL